MNNEIKNVLDPKIRPDIDNIIINKNNTVLFLKGEKSDNNRSRFAMKFEAKTLDPTAKENGSNKFPYKFVPSKKSEGIIEKHMIKIVKKT